MVVETYEVEDVAAATVEQNEEAKALVEQLGLEGQAKLYAPKDDGESPSAFPYRKMTKQERWVYELILPSKTSLGSYADQAIPLRVLQVAAHVAKLIEDRSDCALFVWHPENADYKDPLLVLREGSEYGKNTHYILARWGDELEEYGVLCTKAKAIYRAKVLVALHNEREKLEGWIKNVDAKVEEHFLKGTSGDPHAYWS